MENLVFPNAPSQEALDWAYTMRREMQEILPNLYLGPYAAAIKSKLDVLLNSGITHIVCIRHVMEANYVRANFPQHFRYLELNIADSVTENIIQFFPQVKQFLEECFKCGGKALVHGNAGISRSAALVIGYIMEKYGMSYRDAFLYVQQRRFCINPNDGFAHQLTEYEPIYKARLCFMSGGRSSEKCILKRKFEEDADEDVEMKLPT